MYKSYLTIAWRNLLRNQGYSAINIGGLAIAMTIAMLIGMWVWDELSFDKHHQHYDRLAQVLQQQTVDGKVMTGYALPRPLENAMRQDYGNDFSAISMSTWTDQHILTFNQQSISQTGNFVQDDFPDMISMKMIAGTSRGLSDPKSILLSASTAKALFGDVDPLDQPVRIDNKLDVKVTGIYEDIPGNSSFNEIQFLSSWELEVMTEEWMKRSADQWDNNSFQMYVQLAPDVDLTKVSDKVASVRATRSNDNTFKPKIILHAMPEWHLYSNWENGVKTGGEIELVWMFGIIGIAVLLLACINFINLATARSVKRAKEVGIRMTIGSVRSQLIQQFLSESILVVLVAFVIALGTAQVSLPWFNRLADKSIEIPWGQFTFWLVSAAFILVTSLLAGFYPAFLLSSFRPVQALKSSLKTGRNGSLPRQTLVVFQFTVSIVLLFSTLIIYQQIQYSKNRPIGYDRDGLLTMPVMSPDLFGKFDAFNLEVKRTGAVVEASESSSPLTEIYNNSSTFNWKGKDPELQSSDFGVIAVSEDYGATIGWKIKEGRDFSLEFATDSMALILNEAAVNFIGTKDPIGMEITRGEQKFHVIGIVKDLVMESPYREVRPNIYGMDAKAESANWINLKLNPKRSTSESLASIEAVLKKYAPSVPFVYHFSDVEYGKKFSTEERWVNLRMSLRHSLYSLAASA
ncbi:MAG: ABC transporter permease [Chryseolinea sp.]